MADNAPQSDSVPLSAAQRIDEVCLRFEAAWRAGTPPRLEDFLGDAAGEERAELLRQLLRIELECRRKGGTPPLAEDFLARFPDHTGLIRAVFEGPVPA